MIIKLSEIIDGTKTAFNYVEHKMENIDIVNEVCIEGIIYKNENEYIVESSYDVQLELVCTRCLTKITPMVKGYFKSIFLTEKDYLKCEKLLKKEEEFFENYLEKAKNNEIDISDLVREHIILDMSDYERCVPECLDVSEIDKYTKKDADSRWQQLLDIKL